MSWNKRLVGCLVLLGAGWLATCWLPTALGYVEAPYTLGRIVNESSNIILLRVEKVDKVNNVIWYKKEKDLKGKHPSDVIVHNIGKGGIRPNEWKQAMDWAEPGKLAVMFHNGNASETCIGTWWYQCYGNNQQWNHSHGEPYLLRSYAGNVEKLSGAAVAIADGKEVVVPCMVNGNLEDLHQRRAKIQRLKNSLRLLDYNPQRDFVGWGGEDFRRLIGMAGFTHYAALTKVDPDAQCISLVDIDGDGKVDVCLIGAGKLVVLNNAGESINEISLPGLSGNIGCRSAVWADYNGDGKPDLLLATASGLKLYTNLGKNQFRDDSHLLPTEQVYTVTAAAWIDQNCDGKPDILLANGYHGLRLYRNVTPIKVAAQPLKLTWGKWHVLGPFDNTNGAGFTTEHAVEKQIDLKVTYTGKGGTKASWRQMNYNDGQVNDLLNLYQGNNRVWSACYLFREVESTHDIEVPVSLGSDDTLTVWCNGEKVLANNVYRAAGPDQDQVTLKLKKGKNQVLLKVCQGDGEWAFYFNPGAVMEPGPEGQFFVDVSEEVGLGPKGIATDVKGDTLTICDVDNDGRPDFLYGAASGILVMNTPAGFRIRENSGISYKPGKVGPVFGDFDNSGTFGLLVPQKDGVKLFKNDGKGQFTDVTAKAGDLAKFKGWATSACWGDVDNDGRLDLVLGCIKGPNRVFRNKGDGSFEDVTNHWGLGQRAFNSQAVALIDYNNGSMLDFVFNNEGQESCILLSDVAQAGKKLPISVTVAGRLGVTGSKVCLLDSKGACIGVRQVSGGEGRGGQFSPVARFAVDPGKHRILVQYSDGTRRALVVTVETSQVRVVVDEKTALAKD
jgi:hypothetical protein